MPQSFPICRIAYDRTAAAWAFKVWFKGKDPHYEMNTFFTAREARNWIDAHGERLWVRSGAGLDSVWESREYVRGSVLDRLQAGAPG